MFYSLFKNTFFILAVAIVSCKGNNSSANKNILQQGQLIVGANQTEAYLPMLQGKKVGIVGNQTSVIFKEKGFTHLVDSLLSHQINITKVFSPEHGFRGNADAGEKIADATDPKTGIPIVSLYGNNKKPTAAQLKNIDILVFDIQDVGVRFYTYISTLHYIMEACAEEKIPLLILDRPNPNGNYIDGPILEKKHQSFVGMHPIPIVHGMTIAEYAQMINGEKWLDSSPVPDLMVIKMKHYSKDLPYSLPIKPSPNLPNDKSINLYPSLCFFEGTNVNAGRGTEKQFQVFGSPFLDENHFNYSYTPIPNLGAKNPKHNGKICFGRDLSTYESLAEINLEWLVEAYNHTEDKESFFNAFFTKLAGTEKLQQQIENGVSSSAIKKSWQKGLETYKEVQSKYELYR